MRLVYLLRHPSISTSLGRQAVVASSPPLSVLSLACLHARIVSPTPRPGTVCSRLQAVQSSPASQPYALSSGDDWERLTEEDIDEWYTGTGPRTPLLDTVNFPVHIKNFSMEQLRQLCKEMRSEIVHSVSKTGGHLSSSLGVVELTVALHYVFNTPDDRIIWDVGHQAYGHKILTGRRKGMSTIRQTNGLSGGVETLNPAVSGWRPYTLKTLKDLDRPLQKTWAKPNLNPKTLENPNSPSGVIDP